MTAHPVPAPARPGFPGLGADDNDSANPPFQPLTRAEAQALRQQEPALSPWRVLLVQVGVGVVVALLALLFTSQASIALSALYGAATVVVPGALMARGMTSRFTSMSPMASAAGFMVWEMVKIGVSVLMLMLAPMFVQSLSWPALLVGLVLCIKVYWLALLWRPGSRTTRIEGR